MKPLILILFFIFPCILFAQNAGTVETDPENKSINLSDDETNPETDLKSENIDKTTKSKSKMVVFSYPDLIHMPSTQALQKNILNFRFNHRFGTTKETLNDFFGLDKGANTELALDYGITNKLSFGLSRISDHKTYEVNSKYAVVSQSGSFPVDISIFGAAGIETERQILTIGPYITPRTGNAALDEVLKRDLNQYQLSDKDKVSYMASLLFARKIGKSFAMQLTPSYVHRNFVKTNLSNDRLGLGIGGYCKLHGALTLVFETILLPKRDYIGENYAVEDSKSYGDTKNLTADEINANYYRPTDLPYVYLRNVYYDKKVSYLSTPVSVGLGYETGGHTYSIFLTNESTMARTQLLRGAEYDYLDREWTIGFNMSRYYSFEKKISEENF